MCRNIMRLLVLGLMAPVAVFTTGCPQGSGEEICVTPDTLDFGLTQTTLTFDVNNCGSFFTTAQFEVVPQSAPWITSVNPSNGQSFALFGAGTPVTITVTIDREALAPGVISTGIILVGPTSPESSATTQTITVRATGEGVIEGEAEVDGEEGEGGGEGQEGGIDGEEGEAEPPCPALECPVPCETVCVHPTVDSDVQARLNELLALPVLGQDPNTADLDTNGILDIAHANLLDIVLANEELPVHCCVFAAWDTNLNLVVDALDAYEAGLEGEEENIVDAIGRPILESVFAGLATLGECRTQDVLESIVSTLGIPLDPSAFDLSARMYLASDGDADLDGVCNLAEFRGANGDPFGFILASIDAETTINGGGCGLPCYLGGGGEGEGGEGDGAGGNEAEEEEAEDPNELCEVILNQAQVVPPSGVSASGTATFSTFNDQVLLVVEHTVADATTIRLFQGLPGANGIPFGDPFPSANSPSFQLLSPSFYTAISNGGFYIQIISDSRPGGAIRGNIDCNGTTEGEAEVDGAVDGEGDVDGTADGEGDGTADGEGEVEAEFGPHPDTHSADYQAPFNRITLSELIRVIQFFNVDGTKGVGANGQYGCAGGTDEGFLPGGTAKNCRPHDLDYSPQDWRITLNEVLRLIQIYNFLDGSYYYCPTAGEQDDFCLGDDPTP